VEVEAGTLVTPNGVEEGVLLKLEGRGSIYGETVLIPGFADAHAHPQVVDVGRGLWRNSYEWMRGRRLRVDEASLRADIELSSRLAAAAMLRGLLEGVTLMAMVGRGDANLLAYRRLPVKPRLVLMPTVMDLHAGWPSTWGALSLVLSLSSLDGSVPLGLFVHSLGHVTIDSLRTAYSLARRMSMPFGIHLSEGVDELGRLVSILGLREGVDSGIIAVHCISGSGYERYGIRVVHCPYSNMVLYGRTLRSLRHVDALGSDWPLLLGSALSAYRVAVKVHGRDKARLLLDRATAGGYRLFRLDWSGDLVVFDEPLERVLEGVGTPRLVAVEGRVVVEEGELVGLGLSRRDVDRMVVQLVGEALERHPV